jgi:hypothetical protein
VYKDGALFISNIPNANASFAGITFDTVGTFGLALIVTTANTVSGYNSSGAPLFAYPTPTGFTLENATVAPLSNAACSGCLYLAARSTVLSPGAIYEIMPNSPSGTAPTLVATAPVGALEPEGIVFVSPQACSLKSTNLSFFVSAFAEGGQRFGTFSTNGSLLGFTNAEIAPYAGQFLVPFENGLIATFNGSSFTGNFADLTATFQLEGSSIVQCAPAPGGCPATQGYWKHHSFPASLFGVDKTVVIAGVHYTAAQLVEILNTPPQGGNAALILMHQLIAALANEAAGARNIGVVENGVNVNAAIAAAEALLQFGLPQSGFPGSNPSGVSFPINFNQSSGNFVASSSILGGYLTSLSNVLDAYNSAQGLNCQEASGLVGTGGKN